MKHTGAPRLIALGKDAPRTPNLPPPLLSLEAAAKALGVGKGTIKRLVADGTVYSIPVGESGKYRKIPVAEIEKWRNGRYGHGTSGSESGG